MYTIKSPIKALGLRLVNTWVLYLGVWTVGGGGLGVIISIKNRPVARIICGGGGAYLNNRDQVINIGMIHYASSEDSVQPRE